MRKLNLKDKINDLIDNLLRHWLVRMQTKDHQQNEYSSRTLTLEYSEKDN